MYITVEISYYPLTSSFENPVDEFIHQIRLYKNIEIEIGQMSSLISGDYDDVMNALTTTMKKLSEKFPSVFNLKISNACQVK